MSTDLKSWAFRHSEYLKLNNGETVLVRFIKAEEFVDHENQDRDKIRYTFEVDGVEKKLESQSVSLAEQMGGVEFGEWCKITRNGEGRSTTFDVELVNREDVENGGVDVDAVDEEMIKEARGRKK